MQSNDKDKKRKPTLRELMAAQGKISLNPQPPQKSEQKPQPQQKPAQKPRTEEEKKRLVAELANKLGAQMTPKQAQTKEDKIREMVDKDPEKAAEMLRQMFLKGK